jgi:hypothetical protein
VLPKPGEGPSQRERETGRYDLLFIGETADGRTLRAVVTGDRDPGYGSTSKMISESALCLVEEVDRAMTPAASGRPGRRWGWRWCAGCRSARGSVFRSRIDGRACIRSTADFHAWPWRRSSPC